MVSPVTIWAAAANGTRAGWTLSSFLVADGDPGEVIGLIDEESALHNARLPRLHRDPFDRMLVAQAIVHGMTIVTPDPILRQYPARTTW